MHRTRSATIPVDEHISRAWNLIVDDVVYCRNVQPPCRDVSREENGVGCCLESVGSDSAGAKNSAVDKLPIEVFQALALLQLRMQRKRFEVEQLQQRRETPDPINRR